MRPIVTLLLSFWLLCGCQKPNATHTASPTATPSTAPTATVTEDQDTAVHTIENQESNADIVDESELEGNSDKNLRPGQEFMRGMEVVR